MAQKLWTCIHLNIQISSPLITFMNRAYSKVIRLAKTASSIWHLSNLKRVWIWAKIPKANSSGKKWVPHSTVTKQRHHS